MSDELLDLPTPTSPESSEFATRDSADVSWWAYAKAYDLMCEANPAYQDNLALLSEWMQQVPLPTHPSVCDLGAGTGNYLLTIGRQIPQAHLIHIDWNSAMTARAVEKYERHDLNVDLLNCSMDDAELPSQSLDVAICFNALYAFSNRETNIEKLLGWLKPGGYFFVMDMGRAMDTGDWARYMMKHYVKQYGVYNTIKRLYRTRAAIPANKQVRQHQDSGVYWLHSTDTFKSWLTARGFQVEHIQSCYRGIGDFAVCRKSASAVE